MFMGWEGLEAERKGIELNAFDLADYGIPYGYSPLLARHATRAAPPAPRTIRDTPHEGHPSLALCGSS